MGFYTQYNEVFTQVKTTLETKKTIKKIFLGEQPNITVLPTAIINPQPTIMKPGAVASRLEAEIKFNIVLIILEKEPANWFTETITVMSDTVDALMIDPTLAGKVRFVYPSNFTPYLEMKMNNRILYGGLISFSAFKTVTVQT